jgi:hypothetical protein
MLEGWFEEEVEEEVEFSNSPELPRLACLLCLGCKVAQKKKLQTARPTLDGDYRFL